MDDVLSIQGHQLTGDTDRAEVLQQRLKEFLDTGFNGDTVKSNHFQRVPLSKEEKNEIVTKIVSKESSFQGSTFLVESQRSVTTTVFFIKSDIDDEGVTNGEPLTLSVNGFAIARVRTRSSKAGGKPSSTNPIESAEFEIQLKKDNETALLEVDPYDLKDLSMVGRDTRSFWHRFESALGAGEGARARAARCLSELGRMTIETALNDTKRSVSIDIQPSSAEETQANRDEANSPPDREVAEGEERDLSKPDLIKPLLDALDAQSESLTKGDRVWLGCL